MSAPTLPSGDVVLLRPDSWIPIGDARTPIPAVEDDFRGMVKAFPNCSSEWGSSSAGGEYWMDSGEWYDIASNLTGPDRRQGALIGFYMEAFVFGAHTNDALDTFSMSVGGVLRGQFIQQETIFTQSFASSGEPCGHLRLWMGAPLLPVFNRPQYNNLEVKGDFIVSGVQEGGSIMIVNATAVLQGKSTDSVSTTTTPPVTSNTPPPNPTPASKSNLGIIIPAVVVPLLGLAAIIILGVWLFKRRRAQRHHAEPHNRADWQHAPAERIDPQSPSGTPSVTAYMLAGTSITNTSDLATSKDKFALLGEKLTPLPVPTLLDSTVDLTTPKHTLRGISVAQDRSSDARTSGVYLPSPSSAPPSTLPPPSPPLLSTVLPAHSSTMSPSAGSPRSVSNPDEEDDETALRELRGAMRSAGFTINSLFARLGAGASPSSGRAESVVDHLEDGLPAYDASAGASNPQSTSPAARIPDVTASVGPRRLPPVPNEGG